MTPHTNFIISPAGTHPATGGGPGGGYTPLQVRQAYGLDNITVGGVTGNGAGQTIVLVDLYDQPTVFSDLATFDSYYGLPAPPSFTKVNDQGDASPLPASDSQGGWGVEEDLDVEWAHSVAPMANLILMEVDPNDDLLAAAQLAGSLPGVSEVSMSFTTNTINYGVYNTDHEGEDQSSYDSGFATPAGHTGITWLAATGDYGATASYPGLLAERSRRGWDLAVR